MLKCYRDEHGYRRAIDELHVNIGGYFEEDVQDSVPVCAELFGAIEKVARGEVAEFTAVGNAYEIIIKSKMVTIENLYDETLGVACLSIEWFKVDLSQWLAFVTSAEGKDP